MNRQRRASAFSARPARSAIRRSTWSRAIPTASRSRRSRRERQLARSSRRCAGVHARASRRCSTRDAARALARGARAATGFATARRSPGRKADSSAPRRSPAADTVVAAIVGAAGLAPTLAAARAGKRILLANKEALVIGGAAFMAAVDEGGGELLPDRQRAQRDLPVPAARATRAIRRPRGRAAHPAHRVGRTVPDARAGRALATVTPEEACAHPELGDGPQDQRRFGDDDEQGPRGDRGALAVRRRRARRIEVVIHPQSVIHSLVEYVDGSRARATRRIPTCARRSPRRSRVPTASTRASRRSSSRARRRSRSSRRTRARFPCLAARLRGARRRRHGAGGPQRRQRDRGRRVPRRRHPLHRHRAGLRRGARSAARAAPVHRLDDALAADARRARSSRAPG